MNFVLKAIERLGLMCRVICIRGTQLGSGAKSLTTEVDKLVTPWGSLHPVGRGAKADPFCPSVPRLVSKQKGMLRS